MTQHVDQMDQQWHRDEQKAEREGGIQKQSLGRFTSRERVWLTFQLGQQLSRGQKFRKDGIQWFAGPHLHVFDR